jgi:transposase InsO family protein
MKLSQHKKAKTTPATRQEIKESSLSTNQLAKKYNLSWSTVKKWRERDSTCDKSSRPKNTRTDLTLKQTDQIIFLRKQFKYTVDEIYFTLMSTYSNLYPMKIYRCLKRHRLNILPVEFLKAERKIKKFKEYGIGYLHIDFIFTRRVNKKRYYIFTCIDRVSKLAFTLLTDRHTINESVRFLREVISFYPYKINYILTDNGSEFGKHGYTNYTKNKTDKKHPFEELCKENNISLRHTQIKHPWTNGMVERFNRKVKDNVVRIKEFKNKEELALKLADYVNRYNRDIRLKGLGYLPPIEYLLKQDVISLEDSKKLDQSLITYRY